MKTRKAAFGVAEKLEIVQTRQQGLSLGDVSKMYGISPTTVSKWTRAYERNGIAGLEAGPKGVVLSFRDNDFANPDGLFAFIREQGSAARVRNDPKDPKNPKGEKTQKLVFLDDWERPDERLKGTAAILRKLASIAEQAKAA